MSPVNRRRVLGRLSQVTSLSLRHPHSVTHVTFVPKGALTHKHSETFNPASSPHSHDDGPGYVRRTRLSDPPPPRSVNRSRVTSGQSYDSRNESNRVNYSHCHTLSHCLCPVSSRPPVLRRRTFRDRLIKELGRVVARDDPDWVRSPTPRWRIGERYTSVSSTLVRYGVQGPGGGTGRESVSYRGGSCLPTDEERKRGRTRVMSRVVTSTD